MNDGCKIQQAISQKGRTFWKRETEIHSCAGGGGGGRGSLSADHFSSDLLRAEAIADLTEITRRMIRTGYDRELSQMYIAVRRDTIAKALAADGVDKMSIKEVQRIESGTLDSKMKKWIHALKIAV
uniref:Uncharacterized protein n=1 Tax=Ananas comosus var. bracteatus TaxID=296719 RepID=A0A6V7NQM7_ANACO|nr:unnamed protein product [Ananas comosus var. bracteatus]